VCIDDGSEYTLCGEGSTFQLVQDLTFKTILDGRSNLTQIKTGVDFEVVHLCVLIVWRVVGSLLEISLQVGYHFCLPTEWTYCSQTIKIKRQQSTFASVLPCSGNGKRKQLSMEARK